MERSLFVGRALARALLLARAALGGDAPLVRCGARLGRDARSLAPRAPPQLEPDALECALAIAVLRAALGGDAREAARQMPHADGGLGLVLLLPAGARGFEGRDLALARQTLERERRRTAFRLVCHAHLQPHTLAQPEGQRVDFDGSDRSHEELDAIRDRRRSYPVRASLAVARFFLASGPRLLP